MISKYTESYIISKEVEVEIDGLTFNLKTLLEDIKAIEHDIMNIYFYTDQGDKYIQIGLIKSRGSRDIHCIAGENLEEISKEANELANKVNLYETRKTTEI